METDTLNKVQDAERINDTRKAELLSSPIEHIDITKFDARPIIDSMGKMSFTSRDLSRATGIYNTMLEDKDCSIILVIAGSTSAGGCMDLYAELVKSNMVDAIVATGASIVDMDFFEALGHKHYQANEIPDDDTLRSLYIDRIYDTYIDEQQLQDCDFTIGKIADSLEPRAYSSRAFIREMGKWLSEGNAKKQGSLVQLAYEHDVPIFCPAFVIHSAGFGLVKHQVDAMKRGGHYMVLEDRRLPRGHRHQDQGWHHRASDDRWRRSEELHAGHRRLRRNPRPPRRRSAQVRSTDHGRRRARRRLLSFDAPGSSELGQGLDRHGTDGVRRGDQRPSAARQRRLAPRCVAQPREAAFREAFRLRLELRRAVRGEECRTLLAEHYRHSSKRSW